MFGRDDPTRHWQGSVVDGDLEPQQSPRQLAVGVLAGVEAMAHVTRHWRDDNANDNAKVLINYDEGNAHNEVDRHTFLERMREVAPGLCTWLEFIYPTDVATHVFYRGRVSSFCSRGPARQPADRRLSCTGEAYGAREFGSRGPPGGFPDTATAHRPSDHPGHCAHFCG